MLRFLEAIDIEEAIQFSWNGSGDLVLTEINGQMHSMHTEMFDQLITRFFVLNNLSSKGRDWFKRSHKSFRKEVGYLFKRQKAQWQSW